MTYVVLLPMLLLVVVLTCAAIGTIVFVIVKAQGKSSAPRTGASPFWALLCIVPVIAVVLLVVGSVVVYFWSYQDLSAPATLTSPASAPAASDSPRMLTRMEAVEQGTESAPVLTSVVEPAVEIPTTDSATETPAASTDAPVEIVIEKPKLEDWIRDREWTSEGSRSVVLKSRQFSEVDRARQDVLAKAVKLVRDDFQKTQGSLDGWNVPLELVKKHAVGNEEYVETITRTTGVNQFYVYRVYRPVELSPEVREVVYQSWRGQAVNHRLWILGLVIGFVTLVLGTTATYFRLDATTNGAYRGRLKLASVSLLVAGGLGLSALLRLA